MKERDKDEGPKLHLGIASFARLAFAMQRTPNPPRNRQRVRKVQTGISLSPIFIIGQLKPQKIDRNISKTSPN